MAEISGQGIPTNQTAAAIGDIYTDTDTGQKYKCDLAYASKDEKGNDFTYYRWIKLKNESSGSGGTIDLYIDNIKKNTEYIGNLKEELGEKETQLTDIQQKMSDSDSNDGFLLCDLNGNIVGHIASFEVWNNESYNKKYGWGGHPYGNGKLPPYSKIAGIFEADLLSVCGGKGRWNKDDTGNFQHGGHLFEGWNAEEDVRLTFGIGTKNKDIAWIQTFHAATQEGSDSGAYYCLLK